jgi:hypothetical protein
MNMKANTSELDSRVSQEQLRDLFDIVNELKRKTGMSVENILEQLRDKEIKLSKRADFIMDCVRDLQKDGNDMDDDAVLKCLACNKPIGQMSDNTPYAPARMKSTLDLKHEREREDDASPERRRPINRKDHLTTFVPTGNGNSKAPAQSKLVRLGGLPHSQDKDKDKHTSDLLAKEPLKMPAVSRGSRKDRPSSAAAAAATATMTDNTDNLRLSASSRAFDTNSHRHVGGGGGRGPESFTDRDMSKMVLGRHLDFVEMTGAVAGYPSLTSGLLPESHNLQGSLSGGFVRPSTAPAARRGRETSSATRHNRNFEAE